MLLSQLSLHNLPLLSTSLLTMSSQQQFIVGTPYLVAMGVYWLTVVQRVRYLLIPFRTTLGAWEPSTGIFSLPSRRHFLQLRRGLISCLQATSTLTTVNPLDHSSHPSVCILHLKWMPQEPCPKWILILQALLCQVSHPCSTGHRHWLEPLLRHHESPSILLWTGNSIEKRSINCG